MKQRQLTTPFTMLRLLPLLALGVGLPALAIGQSTNKLDSEISILTFGDVPRYQHIVQVKTLLLPTNSWSPTMPLPMTIDQYATRAKEHLEKTTKAPYPIRLLRIEIGAIMDLPLRYQADRAGKHIPRYISVQFYYRIPTGEPVSPVDLHVAMLLDGTIAEVRVVHPK